MANDLDPEDNIMLSPLDSSQSTLDILEGDILQQLQSTLEILEEDTLEDSHPMLDISASPKAVKANKSEDDEKSHPLQEVARSQVAELIDIRNTNRYELRPSTQDKHVYSTLCCSFFLKAARKVYGEKLSDKATGDELITGIQKDVWDCLDPAYVTKNASLRKCSSRRSRPLVAS